MCFSIFNGSFRRTLRMWASTHKHKRFYQHVHKVRRGCIAFSKRLRHIHRHVYPYIFIRTTSKCILSVEILLKFLESFYWKLIFIKANKYKVNNLFCLFFSLVLNKNKIFFSFTMQTKAIFKPSSIYIITKKILKKSKN